MGARQWMLIAKTGCMYEVLTFYDVATGCCGETKHKKGVWHEKSFTYEKTSFFVYH